MTNPFDDERLSFFLRHRKDILDWARIESQVFVETDSLLVAVQAMIEERVAAVDPIATGARNDAGTYRRIMLGHPSWPKGLGLALEWQARVDPFGGNLPKYGIFVEPTPALEPQFHRITDLLTLQGFKQEQFKVPEGRVWPMSKPIPKSDVWWQHPAEWQEDIVTRMVDLVPRTAPLVDQALKEAGA